MPYSPVDISVRKHRTKAECKLHTSGMTVPLLRFEFSLVCLKIWLWLLCLDPGVIQCWCSRFLFYVLVFLSLPFFCFCQLPVLLWQSIFSPFYFHSLISMIVCTCVSLALVPVYCPVFLFHLTGLNCAHFFCSHITLVLVLVFVLFWVFYQLH